MGIKISDLPVITIPFSGGERFPVVQSGVTRASNLSSLTNYLSGTFLADSVLRGLSGAWQSNYTTTNANSANWNRGYAGFTTLTANSANWDRAYTTTSANSANWNSVYTTTFNTSANWSNAYTTTNSNSANWSRGYTATSSNSANWNSVYTTTLGTSANWDRGYAGFTTLTANSANWDRAYTTTSANSANWNSVYTTTNSNSANWDRAYTTTSANSGNWNSTYTTVNANSAFWTTGGPILNTITNYLSTNNVLLSSATISNLLSARSYVNNPTGKTIYVDATTGTDTRNGFSKYDLFKPFATISAAASASATGDLIYVRAGAYAILSQINLNDKGHLYFEAGATVNIASGVVAFSYSRNSIPINIFGNADFVLIGTTAGVLTMPSGNAATAVSFECNSISGSSSVSGTLFNCAVGALGIDIKIIQMSLPSLASSNATVFNITGSGKVTARIPYVYCGVFVSGAGAANPGLATEAQLNSDIWTLITYNITAGMNLNRVTTQFRIVNYNHFGVGAALSWTEDTTVESHVFQGIGWTSVAGLPHITFASSAGTTTNKIVRLLQSNRMVYASTNSLSSNVAINVGTHSTFAAAPATSNITFKVGSFTVDADVNAY